MQVHAKVCLISLALITLAACAGEAVDEGRKPLPRPMASGGNGGYTPYGYGGYGTLPKGGASPSLAGTGGQVLGASAGAGAGGAAGARSGGMSGAGAGGTTGSAGSSGSGSSSKAGAGPTEACPSLTVVRLPNGACTERIREFDMGTMIPTSIVLGSDQKTWVDDEDSNQIIQLDGDGRPGIRVKCDEGSSPRALAGGRGDAVLWYTDTKAQTLIKVIKGLQKEVTPLPFKATALALGTNNTDMFLTEFDKAIYLVQPNQTVPKRWEARPSETDIVVVPGDSANPGDKAWISQGFTLAKLAPASGVTEVQLDQAFADGLCLGPDSKLWSTDVEGHRLRGMTFDGRFTDLINLPTGTAPTRIISGPDQAVWFIESGVGMIGRYSTKDHSITHYALPTAYAQLRGLTVGSDNYIWYTVPTSHKVGRLIPDPIAP